MIVLTLLVQGPLLPAVIRWAKLPTDDAAVEEFELAQRAISGAALAALDDLAAEHGISDVVRDRARREGYERLELANARVVARLRAEEQERDDDTAAGDDDAASRMGPIPPGADGDTDGQRAAGQLEMLAVSDDIDLSQRSPLLRHREATRLRLAILDREREVLLRLRREGTIDDLVARRILGDLDIEEIRARGIEKSAD
ncbi:hypothetical protein MHY30_05940 [Microbacterium sp. ACRRU]|nr:hypothetical protein [Microbacterium sp. ACRRU]MCG7417047.1 hypothetical protein [Microbacterium sp. ACRRU]